MISRRTHAFAILFNELPDALKDNARKQFALFRQNTSHPSLRTKLVGATRNQKCKVCEVSIGMGYRATYFVDADTCVWFWIGTHASFDKRY